MFFSREEGIKRRNVHWYREATVKFSKLKLFMRNADGEEKQNNNRFYACYVDGNDPIHVVFPLHLSLSLSHFRSYLLSLPSINSFRDKNEKCSPIISPTSAASVIAIVVTISMSARPSGRPSCRLNHDPAWNCKGRK